MTRNQRIILIDKEHGVPKKFKGKSRELLERAIAGGWTGRLSARGHAIMQHPTGETMSMGSNLSLANRSSQNSEAVLKRVEKLVAAQAPAPVMTTGGNIDADHMPVRLDHTNPEPEEESKMETNVATSDVQVSEPYIVTQRPYMALAGRHRYPSDWVNEVVMSDGTTYLRCRYCDYTHPRNATIGVHASVKHANMKPLLLNKDNKATWVPDEEAAKRENARKNKAHAKRAYRRKKIKSVDHGELLSSEPWTARVNANRGYTSSTCFERTWADGTVDYLCADCSYSSPVARSVTSHYSQEVHRGKHPAVPKPKIVKLHPKAADTVAEVVVEAVQQAANADEILMSIRNLLGDSTLRDEIEMLREQRQALIVMRDEAEVRALKAEGDLAAFKDLARQLSGL